jgi:hypothetical protein
MRDRASGRGREPVVAGFCKGLGVAYLRGNGVGS